MAAIDQLKRNPRQRNWVLIGVVVLVVIVVRLTYTPDRPRTEYFDTQAPRVIAHQGGNLLRPGNTILAFDHARALGADVLEMDVHLTRDGELVVIHDATLDRTTDGQGEVADKTWSEIATLDAAFYWPFEGEAVYRGQGIKVPRLSAILDRYAEARFVIEMKPENAAVAEQLCALLVNKKVATRVVVASFHRSALQAFREVCPQVATSASAREAEQLQWLNTVGLTNLFDAPVPVVQLNYRTVDEALVAQLDDAAVDVEVWTVNEVEDMRRVLRMGVAGVMTDRPDLLLDELGRR